jgi:hypothetical protein
MTAAVIFTLGIFRDEQKNIHRRYDIHLPPACTYNSRSHRQVLVLSENIIRLFTFIEFNSCTNKGTVKLSVLKILMISIDNIKMDFTEVG